jgi:hypothetical protein
MTQRLAIAAVVALALVSIVFAPVVYSPTTVYGPLHQTTPYPTYPNWKSPSCAAFGVGLYYGRTVFQHNNSYQFGCPSSVATLP